MKSAKEMLIAAEERLKSYKKSLGDVSKYIATNPHEDSVWYEFVIWYKSVLREYKTDEQNYIKRLKKECYYEKNGSYEDFECPI